MRQLLSKVGKVRAHTRHCRFENLEPRAYLHGLPTGTPLVAALADDRYEENDTRGAATALGTVSSTTLTGLVMADSNDWYKFSTTATGTSNSRVTLNFSHAQGDLDAALYDANGRLLTSSTGVGNSETLSLANRAAGTYYVRVYGYRGVTNPSYTMGIQANSSTPIPTGTRDLSGAVFNAGDLGYWGQTVNVSAAIKNSGTGASGPFGVQWYLSRDHLGSSDDILLNLSTGGTTVTVNSLAAGGTSSTINATLQLPGTLPTGFSGTFFYLVMRTDGANTVAETNEANNFGQIGLAQDLEAISVFTPITPVSGYTIELNMTGQTVSQQQIFRNAANRWQNVITGDLPNATYNGRVVDDLLIDASATSIDGAGGVLGEAGPDRFRSGGGLPYHGIMRFDTADLASMERNGSLQSVVEHEIAHILGLGTMWSSRGLLTGAGTSNPRYVGTNALTAYNQIFGRNETGVPVENTGGSGTRDSHWRDSILGNEVMTGYAGPGSFLPISRITVGALADLGYSVNYAAADPYTAASVNGSVSAGTRAVASGTRGSVSASVQNSNNSESENLCRLGLARFLECDLAESLARESQVFEPAGRRGARDQGLLHYLREI
ncbi:MAG: CARDB domain-containing protein [Pirellulales bacterium]|nr:CARDB domain-containing protein [Pirellulales bacterium]